MKIGSTLFGAATLLVAGMTIVAIVCAAVFDEILFPTTDGRLSSQVIANVLVIFYLLSIALCWLYCVSFFPAISRASNWRNLMLLSIKYLILPSAIAALLGGMIFLGLFLLGAVPVSS